MNLTCSTGTIEGGRRSVEQAWCVAVFARNNMKAVLNADAETKKCAACGDSNRKFPPKLHPGRAVVMEGHRDV